jgi:hypothetical protein
MKNFTTARMETPLSWRQMLRRKGSLALKVKQELMDKLAYVRNSRNELILKIIPLCRYGKVDVLRERLNRGMVKFAMGYLPCEVAVALQMLADLWLAENFDIEDIK